MAAREKNELENIKRLLVVLLAKLGASSEEIGVGLGMHPGAVRKWMPLGKIKPLKR